MADRTEPTGERPFGRDAEELPHLDVRDGAHVPSKTPPRDPAGTPVAEAAPVREEVAADEVVHPGGARAEAALHPANASEREAGHMANHAAAPPSGSTHAGVEMPKTAKSRKLLMGAVAAVVAILAIMLLIPAGADASPLLTLLSA